MGLSKQSHRQRLIDTFVNRIYLYDDKLIITFNHKDGAQTITLNDIETAFAKFKEFSLIKKKQVNDGLLSHNGYYGWCIEQRGVIDNIMMKYGLFDRG